MRDRYLSLLEERLSQGAIVLELGCGTGALTTERLATRFQVTGVDISGRSIAIARRNGPDATILHADMTALDLPPVSVDAVTAFYTITHIPRAEHGPLLQAIAAWLRPGGPLVASLGVDSVPVAVEADWLGALMYFSHDDPAMNQRLVRAAGLQIRSARVHTEDEDGTAVRFLWVVAAKPVGG